MYALVLYLSGDGVDQRLAAAAVVCDSITYCQHSSSAVLLLPCTAVESARLVHGLSA
jgi:exosortase/archaeosortase